MRRAIGFDLSYSSTSKASPNDTGIVIIIIIMIGKLDVVDHRARIIAQSSVRFSISCIMNLSVGGGVFMKIQVSELEHGLRLVALSGVLDGTG